MRSAWIVDAVRTPVGRKKGALAGAHPADLGAHSIKALLARTGVDPAAIDDVVFGCVDTLGPQAGDIARTCWLAAGGPDHVPGVTVDRQCGSGQQAVHFAAQGVLSGTQDLVIAGGVQNMAMIPIGQAMVAGQALGFGDPFSGSRGWQARYGDQPVDQFRSAERIAERWNCSKDDLHAFAYDSHARAVAAQDAGWFDAEIAPFEGVTADEGPRRDTTLEGMAKLNPVMPGGRHTAAASSQLSVASSALLIASDEAVRTHGLTPLARVVHMSVRGDDPVWMLTAPIPATRHALGKAGMTIDQIDHVEINEAFAAVVLAWEKELGADHARVNPLGGAIALGHPLGATGARLLTTMLHSLKRTGGRYGLQTMCEGGGQANVLIVERA